MIGIHVRSRGQGTLRGVVAGFLGAALLLMPEAAVAGEGSLASEAGLRTSAALLTLPYAPLKITFAAGGGIVGALTWLFSLGDGDAANAVWKPSLGGDYVVSPDHLKGERGLEFIGPILSTPPEVAATDP